MTCDRKALADKLGAIIHTDIIANSIKAFGLTGNDPFVLVSAAGVKSQSEAAVLAINLGVNDAGILTDVLRAAFPNSKVGSRHGPHYISLARTGKLAGVANRNIPHQTRKPRSEVVLAAIVSNTLTEAAPVPSDAELEAAADNFVEDVVADDEGHVVEVIIPDCAADTVTEVLQVVEEMAAECAPLVDEATRQEILEANPEVVEDATTPQVSWADQVAAMSRKELVAACKERGLKTSGKDEALRARLLA